MNVCLSLDNILHFPQIVEKYILKEKIEDLLIFKNWIYGNEKIPLAEETTIDAQLEAYHQEDSNTTFLERVIIITLFIN